MAETVRGYGLTHVFFMPYIAPRALMEMDKLGIKHIQTHGEKAAAYMADGYCTRPARAGALHGAIGRCDESRLRPAGCVSGVFAGDRGYGA